MPFVQYKSQNIHYSDSKKGSHVVLFLHGFLGDLSAWDEYKESLGKSYRVICIDLPGHGRSDALAGVCSMESMAKSVLAVTSSLDIKKFHIVGHSMGGYVSLALARKHPEMLMSLCLFNSTAVNDSEQKQKDRIRAIRVIEKNKSLFINEAINNLFWTTNLAPLEEKVSHSKAVAMNTSFDGISAALRGMATRPNSVQWMAETEVPCLYIAGRYDNVIPYASIEEQVKVNEAQLVTLEATGHMGFLEEPETALAALTTFITSTTK